MFPRNKNALRGFAVAGIACALLAAGCSPGGTKPSTGGTTSTGGSVSVALRTPTWILPISAPGKTQGENGIFRTLQYPGLYDYALTSKAEWNIDTTRSLAKPPVASNDGKTLTMELKDMKWSDGKPITTRDVEFWWNLVGANKDKWASYRKGGIPDNVTEFKVIDEKKFSITTDKAYSPGWYVGNQMNRIVPIPQHVWDKTSADGQIGDHDRTPDGAKKVFEFLFKASEDTASYATNPLWKTVSGPWIIDSYVPNGEVKLKANTAYTGDDKAKLDTVVFRPFTSDDAEFNVLRGGGIDYGYIPAGSIAQKSFIEGKGYTVKPWNGWSITYMPFNFANPKTGPIFKQKYVRQAMQQLIDQPTISKVVWQDAAAPTCGPVPMKPDKAGTTDGCAYAFDPDKAKKLLTDHGWTVGGDGVATCTAPGSGANQCGEGIAQGTALKFDVISQSGFTATTKMFAELKSQFTKAGIELNVKEVPDSVAVSQKCKAGEPCNWDMSFFGSQASWYFPPYASGERLFATDAPVNLGSYSNPEADKLINATQFSSDQAAMDAYNTYLAEDLPVLWMPNPVAQISAWKSDITGIDPQEPTLGMYPQDWARTK